MIFVCLSSSCLSWPSCFNSLSSKVFQIFSSTEASACVLKHLFAVYLTPIVVKFDALKINFMTKIEAFFTTSIENNDYADQFASRILFAPLHVLLNAALDSRAGCSFNVDILRNVVTPIENAEPCCQNLAVRIVILTISLLLVLPCTLLGTFVRAGSILFNPDSAASNAQVADWLVLDKMTPVVQTDTLGIKNIWIHSFSFLQPKEIAQVTQTCKLWRTYAENDLVWQPICKRCSDLVKLENQSYKAVLREAVMEGHVATIEAVGELLDCIVQ